MLGKHVWLRKLGVAAPLTLAGILMIFMPVYLRLHRNPIVRVQNTQTWAVTDPRYREAYQRAAAALVEANPGLTPDKLGEFDPARVWELGGGRYRIRVAYQGSGPSGALIGKDAECIVRFDGGNWSVESAEVIPEFAESPGPTATTPSPAGQARARMNP